MTYTDRQINDAIKTAVNRYYRSAGITAVIGMAGLYLLTQSAFKADVTASAPLVSGFIVGFFVAGIVLPLTLRKELKKLDGKLEKPTS